MSLKKRLFTMGTQLANVVGGVGYLIGFWILMDPATAFANQIPEASSSGGAWVNFAIWLSCGVLVLAQLVYLIYGRSEMKPSDTAFQWMLSTGGLIPLWLPPIALDPLFLAPVVLGAVALGVLFVSRYREEHWTSRKLRRRLRSLEHDLADLDRRTVVHIPVHREMGRIRNMIQHGYSLEAHWAIEDLQQEVRRTQKRRQTTPGRRSPVVAIQPGPYPLFSRLD